MSSAKFKTILLPPIAQPASSRNGEIYHDATLNQIRVNIDGVWTALGSGANGGNGGGAGSAGTCYQTI